MDIHYSFVFTFRDGDDLEIYPSTGENDLYQQSDHEGLIIGGCDGAATGNRASLIVSDRFKQGHSGVSNCYDNFRLCSQARPDTAEQEGDFLVDQLEVWGFADML